MTQTKTTVTARHARGTVSRVAHLAGAALLATELSAAQAAEDAQRLHSAPDVPSAEPGAVDAVVQPAEVLAEADVPVEAAAEGCEDLVGGPAMDYFQGVAGQDAYDRLAAATDVAPANSALVDVAPTATTGAAQVSGGLAAFLAANPVALGLAALGVVGAAAGGGGGGGGGGGSGGSGGSSAAATTVGGNTGSTGGTGGNTGSNGGNTGTPASGTVVDGPVAGATVFYDTNGNGKLDTGEVSTTTDSTGHYTLAYTEAANGKLVSVGGTDIYTGKTVGTLMAENGATVLSPLTTLLAADPTLTETQLKTILGIDASVNLATYNPFAVLADNTADAGEIAKATAVAEISQKVFALLSAAAVSNLTSAGSTNVNVATDVDGEVMTTVASGLVDSLRASNTAGATIDTALSQAAAYLSASDDTGRAAVLTAIETNGVVTTGLSAAESALATLLTQSVSAIDFSTLHTDLVAYTSGTTSALSNFIAQVSNLQESLLNLVENVVAGTAGGLAAIDLIQSGNASDYLDHLYSTVGQTHADGAVVDDSTSHAIELTDAIAGQMLDAGLSYATADTVTLHAAHAEGTILNTSLKDAATLHVDVIAGDAGLLVVAGGADLTATLPDVQATGATLLVSDAELASTIPNADHIVDAGFEKIGAVDTTMTLTGQDMDVLATAGIAVLDSTVVTLDVSDTPANPGGGTDITVHDLAMATQFHAAEIMSTTGIEIDEQTAGLVLDAGLHFADDTQVVLHADGTVLQTSLKDMADLGVDLVAVAGDGSGVHHIMLGDLTDAAKIPTFTSLDKLIVDVAEDQVGAFDAMAMALHDKNIGGASIEVGSTDLAMEGILSEGVRQSGLDLELLVKGDVTLTEVLTAADGTATALVDALAMSETSDGPDFNLAMTLLGSNVKNVAIAEGSSLALSDDAAVELMSVGLLSGVAEANVIVEVLGQSDLMMTNYAELGLDSIKLTAGNTDIAAGVAALQLPDGSLPPAADLLSAYEALLKASSLQDGVFNDASAPENTVTVAFENVAIADIDQATGLLAELKLLGIDAVTGDDGTGNLVTHTLT